MARRKQRKYEFYSDGYESCTPTQTGNGPHHISVCLTRDVAEQIYGILEHCLAQDKWIPTGIGIRGTLKEKNKHSRGPSNVQCYKG